jgi:hypothetical protein
MTFGNPSNELFSVMYPNTSNVNMPRAIIPEILFNLSLVFMMNVFNLDI